MNRPDAAARLEALLARVIARKDAPRAPRAFTQAVTAPAAVQPKAPPAPLPLEPEPSEARDSSPDVSLHPPLAADNALGPEIDLIERTMDLDIPSIEAAVAATQAMAEARVEAPPSQPEVSPPEPTAEEPSRKAPEPVQPQPSEALPEPAPDVTLDLEPAVTVGEPDEFSPIDIASPDEPAVSLDAKRELIPLEPEALPLEPDAAPFEPDALTSVELRVSPPEPAREAPRGRSVVAPPLEVVAPITPPPKVEAPVVETPVVAAPTVEAPAVETPIAPPPKVEAPVIEAPTVEAPKVVRFEPEALPVVAAAVVAAVAPAPRTMREMLTRSLALKVRPEKVG